MEFPQNKGSEHGDIVTYYINETNLQVDLMGLVIFVNILFVPQG